MVVEKAGTVFGNGFFATGCGSCLKISERNLKIFHLLSKVTWFLGGVHACLRKTRL